jgi:gamma-glutamyltranspeptidase/glutathione hydrolase
MEPLTLQILEGIDLKSMGHNSPQYIHTVTQAIELAMADRDTFVADSAFVDVPLDVLLSKEYAAERRVQMTDSAFFNLPAAGNIPGYGSNPASSVPTPDSGFDLASLTDYAIGQDTSQLVVVDGQGNAIVITPSDFPKSPMLPNSGINLGDRMTQFRLDPAHINALEPGKRPRITPHSVIIFKDGKFFMAYSTPGGDMQAQALVQVFLNMEVFGMDIQQAVSAPRFYSISAPSSFSPHEFTPGGIRIESDLYQQVAEQLKALGYVPQEDPSWDKDFGAVGAILIGPDGRLYAGADPREETTALGK